MEPTSSRTQSEALDRDAPLNSVASPTAGRRAALRIVGLGMAMMAALGLSTSTSADAAGQRAAAIALARLMESVAQIIAAAGAVGVAKLTGNAARVALLTGISNAASRHRVIDLTDRPAVVGGPVDADLGASVSQMAHPARIRHASRRSSPARRVHYTLTSARVS